MAVIGLFVISYQIRARRRDDIFKNQLERLNVQISDFYGPLFSIYETGHQNYYSYLVLFGSDVTFNNPNFKVWVHNVFEPTNTAMEDLIINKADLILGKKIPDCFLKFCKWSAIMKVYTRAQLEPNFDKERWKDFLKEINHPQITMQAYLNASFEILKEEQNKLLSGKKNKLLSRKNRLISFGKEYINEELLIEEIKKRSEEYIEKSQDPNTEENKSWAKINDNMNSTKSVAAKSLKIATKPFKYLRVLCVMGILAYVFGKELKQRKA